MPIRNPLDLMRLRLDHIFILSHIDSILINGVVKISDGPHMGFNLGSQFCDCLLSAVKLGLYQFLFLARGIVLVLHLLLGLFQGLFQALNFVDLFLYDFFSLRGFALEIVGGDCEYLDFAF